MSTEKILEISSVSFALGTHAILDGVSFSVRRGEFLCIIGPNGAGKSTLLKCAGGLHKSYTGKVLLDGVPLAGMKRRDIARRIAWVHQTGTDSLPFTVREFALMSRYPWQTSAGCDIRADREAVDRALETAGVSHIADRELMSLSGGERQKALIAAALAQGTDILFLDEPTSFLDYRHQAETVSLIEKINKEEKKTILMVTHDINLALHGADRIVAIKGGQVAVSGSRAELSDKALLSDIFGTEFQCFDGGNGNIPYVAPRWR
ncbi:MAG: ABC transporter ATP-binding protein [Synergistaceae bacterium]